MEYVHHQGVDRLEAVASKQFAYDGGHLEHSPDYHRLLLGSFLDAMDDGLLDSADARERIVRAAEVMGWFIRPDRRTVEIGDSPARRVPPRGRTFSTPHTQFLASSGRAGIPNPEEMLILKESGYGFVRSPQPKGTDDHLGAGYLSFMAGFHSRTHKHCDDLSVTWFDREQEILIDSGRFGYLDPLPRDSPDRLKGFYYGRPERQYVESVVAHNTVQFDRQDHDRRNRAPYGSALSFGQKRDGQFRIVGRVDHGDWVHHRTVTLCPGEWLLVDDFVQVTSSSKHSFVVWWNLAEAFDRPTISNDRVEFSMGRKSGTLSVISLSGDELVEPVRGQSVPLRGWRSASDYEFTPSWSMGHRVTASSEHRFETLLAFDEDAWRRPSTAFDDDSPSV
ncbi:hypothetical protein GCM10023216_04930 [Isoptericola chiayiensis]|uniref:Heparinase II/III-like C-terminal domain-containing protein n=2 Tax=Isoptericola chiayiensis TaxID=579446 RepID=A0ABP8Y3N9_9MICO